MSGPCKRRISGQLPDIFPPPKNGRPPPDTWGQQWHSLIVADTADPARYDAKKLEGLAGVHDGSDLDGNTAPAHALVEVYARVRL
ncbi:MAG TPA: hypothetical protein VFA26_00315 [Gemmataceae bacterium]|nr:hypothetical protein [Gemmataceae bacterium]